MAAEHPAEREIQCAAHWWANKLSLPLIHDNGDPLQSALATWVAARQQRPTEQQIEDFRDCLCVLLRTAIRNGLWDLAKPQCGSAVEGRVLAVDYGPDRLLSMAAQAAGIHYGATLFPIKTTMWLSPGCVKVRQGYGAPEKEVPIDATSETATPSGQSANSPQDGAASN